MNRFEQLKSDMDGNVNPLIPGGEAARRAIVQAEAADKSRAGMLHREMSPTENPLIIRPPGAPASMQEAFDQANRKKDLEAELLRAQVQ